jgi:tRNA uridine 5-carboxymethylaminomethyl modification enzyme
MVYDVIVIGGGHAGCEGALAASRLGCRTLMLTIKYEDIALMPCNPSLGGPGKGQLIRELDALGGEMARNIDQEYMQMRLLNRGKGPAVRALRAQADLAGYQRRMRRVVRSQADLEVAEGKVTDLYGGPPWIVETADGGRYEGRCVIVATGTHLRAEIHRGDERFAPEGSSDLTTALERLGLRTIRLKTGTSPRVDGRTIDYSKMQIQPGEDLREGFSFDGELPRKRQAPCYLTYTTEATEALVLENLNRASLFSGAIVGVGPRYCPSIEIKMHRFAGRRQQVFIEPLGWQTPTVYLAGVSTSLPREIQEKLLATIPGLEKARITAFGYAIEYDSLEWGQLGSTLQIKDRDGLFFAGQINGTSGYEEAAVQGLIAGINAAAKVKGEEPLILGRDEAYIGVLIDDLVTKELDEPYRMLTARVEYRLSLRQDNADWRLMEVGHRRGLIDGKRLARMQRRWEMVWAAKEHLEEAAVSPRQEVQEILTAAGTSPLAEPATLAEILRRQDVDYGLIVKLGGRPLPPEIAALVEVEVKYAGYLAKEKKAVERFRRLEGMMLPENWDYASITGLSQEAKEKLSRARPRSLGQAARIGGVSPADMSVLMVALHRERGMKS